MIYVRPFHVPQVLPEYLTAGGLCSICSLYVTLIRVILHLFFSPGNILSIAFFNFSGISVTKEMSATTRMVLDSMRTVVIWAVSLGVGWQSFGLNSFFMQLGGFVLLILGMCFYNNMLIRPLLRKCGCLRSEREGREMRDPDEFRPLLRNEENAGRQKFCFTIILKIFFFCF